MSLPDQSSDGVAPSSADNKTSRYIKSTCLVLAVAGLGLISNRLLFSSSGNASTMCGDSTILQKAKELIHEQTPNIGELSDVLQRLDASRGGAIRDPLAEKEKLLRETKEYYARNPVDPNDRSMGDQNAARADRIATLEREVAELEAKFGPGRRKREEIRRTPVEIIVASDPAPVEYDPVTNRAACKLAYRVKGFGYDSPGMQLSTPTTAVYTIQQAAGDWIVNLVALN